MAARPSIIYEACARFDALKAISVSRHAEKQRLRREAAARGVVLPALALSTGRIHSDKTLITYKGIALRYVRWAREEADVRCLADLDAQAPRLVSLYLATLLAAGRSPYTLQTVRSALRMFHRPAYPLDVREERVRALGAEVCLPPRRRTAITRSRSPVAMDRAIALDRYLVLIGCCLATGLRRRELAALTAADVREDAGGRLRIRVRNGKGGKPRIVPVLPGLEDNVRRLVAGRAPNDRLFPRVPSRLDVHSYRRLYAQALYGERGRRPLPPPDDRLAPGSVDPERGLYVVRALGHNRLDVLTRHYLR